MCSLFLHSIIHKINLKFQVFYTPVIIHTEKTIKRTRPTFRMWLTLFS